jgi:hypothetical protein
MFPLVGDIYRDMSNYKLSKNDTVVPNLAEIGKIVKEMQNDSLEKHRTANNFNQKGADIIAQGVTDKKLARGWPITPSEKKVM